MIERTQINKNFRVLKIFRSYKDAMRTKHLRIRGTETGFKLFKWNDLVVWRERAQETITVSRQALRGPHRGEEGSSAPCQVGVWLLSQKRISEHVTKRHTQTVSGGVRAATLTIANRIVRAKVLPSEAGDTDLVWEVSFTMHELGCFA